MSLAPADLRSRIESRIAAVLGAGSPPWRVAGLVYDLFPGADLSDREALSYAVGLPRTDFIDGRQPSGGQAPARSIVGVKFTSYLRTDAHVADYSVAIGREALLIAAVRGTVGTGGPSTRVVNVTREVLGDGTVFVADVLFEVFHGYPL
jgi:hypothetical protein